MKSLFLACFCIFTFEEAFSQTRFIDVGKEQDLKNQSSDEVRTGRSATVRKTTPTGTSEETQKYDSIKGVNCVDTRGQAFAPNSKGYKKCVNKANRVQ